MVNKELCLYFIGSKNDLDRLSVDNPSYTNVLNVQLGHIPTITSYSFRELRQLMVDHKSVAEMLSNLLVATLGFP